MGMKGVWWGVAAMAAGMGVLIACGNSPSSSSTGNLFVTTQGDTSAYAFLANLGNGKLSTNGAKVDTGGAPAAMALTPGGDAAFVANSQCVSGNDVCNSVSRYTVNSDGTLSALSGAQAAGTNPVALAVNPAGNLLFVANQGSSDISVFSIGSGVALTEVAGSPFPSGANPVSLAVSPSGNFLYVANSVSGVVSAYAIGSSGALTAVPGSPFTGTNTITPAGVTVTPNGNFVFVSNSGSNNVSAFAACIAVSNLCPAADGSLVEVSGSPFGAGLKPGPLAVESSGNFLYVVDTGSSQVSGFRISTGSGALTPTSPAAASTGGRPVALAIHPDGLWLYTANFGASNITGFEIEATTGALTPISPLSIAGGQPSALAIK